MLLPAVTPFKEYTAGMLLRNLRSITSKISSYFSGDEYLVLQQYQAWATESTRVLSTIFDTNDVEKLITTPRHWYLMSAEPLGRGPAIHAAVQIECQDRLRVLTELEEALRQIDAGWGDMADTSVIAPDTNIYLQREETFWEFDWLALAGKPRVRLLVPVAVFRELDKAKRTPGNKKVVDHRKELVRDRARVTSRELRKRLPEPGSTGEIAPGVEVELVLDTTGHRAIDDPDSEIIDRLAAVHRLTGHRVAVFTDDGNMEYGAKIAGLDAIRC